MSHFAETLTHNESKCLKHVCINISNSSLMRCSQARARICLMANLRCLIWEHAKTATCTEIYMLLLILLIGHHHGSIHTHLCIKVKQESVLSNLLVRIFYVIMFILFTYKLSVVINWGKMYSMNATITIVWCWGYSIEPRWSIPIIAYLIDQ